MRLNTLYFLYCSIFLCCSLKRIQRPYEFAALTRNFSFTPVSDNKQFQHTHTHIPVYNTTQRIIIRFRITPSSLWEILGLPVTNDKASNQFLTLPCTHAATEIHSFNTFFRRSKFPSRRCDWHQAGYPSSQDIWSSDVSARTSGFPAASDGEWCSEVQRWQR